MLDVVIERSRWGRGGNGSLRGVHDLKQCCLGFVCETIGMPEYTFIGQVEIPEAVNNEELSYDEQEGYFNQIKGLIELGSDLDFEDYKCYQATETHNDLAIINDIILLEDPDREARIIELGKKADINFSFVD